MLVVIVLVVFVFVVVVVVVVVIVVVVIVVSLLVVVVVGIVVVVIVVIVVSLLLVIVVVVVLIVVVVVQHSKFSYFISQVVILYNVAGRTVNSQAHFVSMRIAVFNSLLNPIIGAVMCKPYRRGYKYIVCRILHCCGVCSSTQVQGNGDCRVPSDRDFLLSVFRFQFRWQLANQSIKPNNFSPSLPVAISQSNPTIYSLYFRWWQLANQSIKPNEISSSGGGD